MNDCVRKTIKYNLRHMLCIILLILCISGCSAEDSTAAPAGTPSPAVSAPAASPSADSEPSDAATMPKQLIIGDKARDMAAQMTLDEKVYQMMFVTPESITGIGRVVQAGDTTRKALESKPVGGIIYFGANIQSSEQVREMIANTQQYSKIPLFIGVDEEGGRVSRLGSNLPDFPEFPPMAEIGKSGNGADAYRVGETLSAALYDLGFNVNFAPVADLLLNPANTEIGDRAFGSDAEPVADMVENAVLGLQGGNVCAVLKHFPGHGSISIDTHKAHAESERTLSEMQAAEFIAFSRGIDAGADFVLLSHLSAINVDPSGTPSSLSRIIIDILQEQLGFEKLIITDSLGMGAVTGGYRTDSIGVIAINAGVDVILIPDSPEAMHRAILAAVQSGEITEARITHSVEKILQIKIDRGII